MLLDSPVMSNLSGGIVGGGGGSNSGGGGGGNSLSRLVRLVCLSNVFVFLEPILWMENKPA